jgi:hypothetical protein
MKRFIILAAATAIAVAATPALAKAKKKHHVQPGYGYYGETYGPVGYWAGIAAPTVDWRRSGDPSIGHPSAAALSRASGRCVEDLGYGRFKYCGW